MVAGLRRRRPPPPDARPGGIRPARRPEPAHGGQAGPFTISQCVLDNAVTVDNLLAIANQALRGIPLSQIDPCLTYSDITAALDALNNGFDACRTVCACAP